MLDVLLVILLSILLAIQSGVLYTTVRKMRFYQEIEERIDDLEHQLNICDTKRKTTELHVQALTEMTEVASENIEELNKTIACVYKLYELQDRETNKIKNWCYQNVESLRNQINKPYTGNLVEDTDVLTEQPTEQKATVEVLEDENELHFGEKK